MTFVVASATQVFNSYLWDYLIVDLRSTSAYEKAHLDRAEPAAAGEWEKHEQPDLVIAYDEDGTVCVKPSDDNKKILERFRERSKIRSIWLLEGGYNRFCKEFPFLCTDHPDCDPRLCYPQKITDHIFLGSKICADEEKIIQNLKLSHILNCTTECRDHFEDSSAFSLQYSRISVEDSLQEDLSPHFETAIDFLESVKRANGRVLVHCSRGVSRSAAFIIAYLIKSEQMGASEALKFIKERRSIVSPNQAFILQLEQFASCQ